MPTVLIVEDNLMIADMTEEILMANGYDVCGIAGTVESAISIYRQHRPDLAIVDLRLAHGELGTAVAAQLSRLDRPGILYVTGNMWQEALTTDDGDACLGKPHTASDLLRALDLVTQIAAKGTVEQPFPRGFRILHAPTESGGPARP